MNVQILNGDCREVLKTLPDESVNCCVTSPPYFGLRDYGNQYQIGLEETPEAYIAEMVSVFKQVRRVLRQDGTLWLNIGDSYVSKPTGSLGNFTGTKHGFGSSHAHQKEALKRPDKSKFGIPEKNLIGIPWMLAFALRADGWYLRQDIIWHKPNPMPESVTDRCTKAHEYIFFMSKSAKYYFDSDAMKEPSKDGNIVRNRRSVWSVASKPYKGAHFATYPPDLIKPCILAGCPKGGTVLDPFGGSGTTGMVSYENNRNAILIELNSDYIPLINKRINSEQPKLFII